MLYSFCKSVLWVFFHLIYKIEIRGHKNIPNEGGALICPNHFCWADPLVIAIAMRRRVMFMAKYQAFRNAFFSFFLKKLGAYPVKRGEVDINAFKTTLKALKENKLIVLFPEGTRVKGEELGKANPGAAMFSIKANKPVIPVGISGNYRLFSRMIVNFGQPIEFDEFKGKKLSNDEYSQLGDQIMQKIKSLKRGEI